jgi:hypothetical protein
VYPDGFTFPNPVKAKLFTAPCAIDETAAPAKAFADELNDQSDD